MDNPQYHWLHTAWLGVETLASSVRRERFWPEFLLALALCCSGGVSLIAMQVLWWYLPPFGGALLIMPVAMIFGLSMLGSIAYGWSHRREATRVLLPWLINGACIWIFWSRVITSVQIQTDFNAHREARERVVQLVERGELQPWLDSRGHSQSYGYWVGLGVKLPSEFESTVARGRNLRIWELDGVTHVLFVVQGGGLNIGGFVYRSDDHVPLPSPRAIGGPSFALVHLIAPHWWWVEHGD